MRIPVSWLNELLSQPLDQFPLDVWRALTQRRLRGDLEQEVGVGDREGLLGLFVVTGHVAPLPVGPLQQLEGAIALAPGLVPLPPRLIPLAARLVPLELGLIPLEDGLIAFPEGLGVWKEERALAHASSPMADRAITP